ncbi:hypothetical protein [Sphingomonas hengshuiensis]|uniref:Uncharacterized protein n=1 Tax=Sphingomonas hengshuiensis TaxID=1609977 RepID=A0A7U4J9V3_9SPHN|nr:hypothetical protein [Sphingomonas hengshuiensis]AJP72917.1 hypothetical protein TS85_15655 [Sphingomonas hengshuiensis]
METNIIAQLAGQFGATGLIIGYLIWDRRTTGKERMTFDLARLEADKALAASLAALKTIIEKLVP